MRIATTYPVKKRDDRRVLDMRPTSKRGKSALPVFERWSFRVTLGKVENEEEEMVSGVKVASGYRSVLGGAWASVSAVEFVYAEGGIVYMTWTHTTVDENGNVVTPGSWSAVLYDVSPPAQTSTLSVFRIATTAESAVVHEHLGNIMAIDVAPCTTEGS